VWLAYLPAPFALLYAILSNNHFFHSYAVYRLPSRALTPMPMSMSLFLCLCLCLQYVYEYVYVYVYVYCSSGCCNSIIIRKLSTVFATTQRVVVSVCFGKPTIRYILLSTNSRCTLALACSHYCHFWTFLVGKKNRTKPKQTS
jgi:hypothetical protein